jgi:hypothetical protein
MQRSEAPLLPCPLLSDSATADASVSAISLTHSTACPPCPYLQAWVSPLNIAVRLRRLGGDTQERAAAWLVKQTSSLQHREALLPAAIKLCLAATSGAAVWGAVLCTCAVEYGQHTLMGWVWRLGVWKPHYTLQVRA